MHSPQKKLLRFIPNSHMNSDGPQKPSEKWDGPNAWPLRSPLSIFVRSPPFTAITIKISLMLECDHALWQEHHDHIMRPERGAEGFQGFDWPAQTNLSKEGLRRQGGPSSRTMYGRRRLCVRRYRCYHCYRPYPRRFGLWPGPSARSLALWPQSLICQLDGHTSCVTTHNTACQTRGDAEHGIQSSPWMKSHQRLRGFFGRSPFVLSVSWDTPSIVPPLGSLGNTRPGSIGLLKQVSTPVIQRARNSLGPCDSTANKITEIIHLWKHASVCACMCIGCWGWRVWEPNKLPSFIINSESLWRFSAGDRAFTQEPCVDQMESLWDQINDQAQTK